MGAVFMMAALVYVALAYAGKLSGARKPLAAVVAVLAVVFCVFVGLAYMIPTVSSWNSALLPIEVVGYALVGGCAFGALALAGQGAEVGAAGKALRVAAVAGAVVAIVAVAVQLAMLPVRTRLLPAVRKSSPRLRRSRLSAWCWLPWRPRSCFAASRRT